MLQRPTVIVTASGAKSLFTKSIPRRIALIPPADRRPFGPEESLRVRRVLNLEPTPLERLRLVQGLGDVYVKDESKRLGLQAFKVVGGAYAMLRFMCKRLALPMIEEHAALAGLQREYSARFGSTTFVTATDGNHGRGVAWAAKEFGQKAVVLMPKGSAQRRLQHVLDLGAQAEITDLNYDDTVAQAFQLGRDKGWVVLQDTTAPGYTEIPEWIMQGYTAMVHESLETMGRGIDIPIHPSHVLLQMGVGSMAAAVVGHFTALPQKLPKFVVLEPKNAACGFESAKKGELTEVTGDLETMIAGLACGIPSSIAWPILEAHVTAFVSLDDQLAGNGMRLLKRHHVEAGECGGAAAGFLEYVMMSRCVNAAALRKMLELGPESKVLVINTEGATDPENYQLQLSLPHVNPAESTGLLSFQLGRACHVALEQDTKRTRALWGSSNWCSEVFWGVLRCLEMFWSMKPSNVMWRVSLLRLILLANTCIGHHWPVSIRSLKSIPLQQERVFPRPFGHLCIVYCCFQHFSTNVVKTIINKLPIWEWFITPTVSMVMTGGWFIIVLI